MNRDIDVTLSEAWQKMPPVRRHTYFFTLLVLVTIAVAHFQEDFATFKRLIPAPEVPPRITSQEVYPAPVNL
jgi:pheromone shutdown protein TraB